MPAPSLIALRSMLLVLMIAVSTVLLVLLPPSAADAAALAQGIDAAGCAAPSGRTDRCSTARPWSGGAGDASISADGQVAAEAGGDAGASLRVLLRTAGSRLEPSIVPGSCVGGVGPGVDIDCVQVPWIGHPRAIVVSPDGGHLVVAGAGAGFDVVDVPIAPLTGVIGAPAGCLAAAPLLPCVGARTSALAIDVAISPAGNLVAVLDALGSVHVLRRDPLTGAIGAGRVLASCSANGLTAPGCIDLSLPGALSAATFVAISGAPLLAIASREGGWVATTRIDVATGAPTAAGIIGCVIDEQRAPRTGCTTVGGLAAVDRLDADPAGTLLAAASATRPELALLTVDQASGGLAMGAGPQGCLTGLTGRTCYGAASLTPADDLIVDSGPNGVVAALVQDGQVHAYRADAAGAFSSTGAWCVDPLARAGCTPLRGVSDGSRLLGSPVTELHVVGRSPGSGIAHLAADGFSCRDLAVEVPSGAPLQVTLPCGGLRGVPVVTLDSAPATGTVDITGASAGVLLLDGTAATSAASTALLSVRDRTTGVTAAVRLDIAWVLPPFTSTAPPVILGGATDGSLLRVMPASWSITPSSRTWTWYRCAPASTCTALSSASTDTYRVTADDIGATIGVVERAQAGRTEVASTLARTAVIVAARPVLLAAPVITGTFQQGSVLVATDGDWGGTPAIATSRTWWMCRSPTLTSCQQTTSTGSQFVVTAAWGGWYPRIDIVASGPGGSAQARTISPIAIVPISAVLVSPPVVTAMPVEGTPADSTFGTWASSVGSTWQFRWLRCGETLDTCQPIVGATMLRYTPTAVDVGRRLRTDVVVMSTAGVTVGSSALSAPVTVPVPFLQSPSALVVAPTVRLAWAGSWVLAAAPSWDVRSTTSDLRTGAVTDDPSVAAASTLAWLTTPIAPGARRCWQVRGRDPLGNASDWSIPRCSLAGIEAETLQRSGPWSVTLAGGHAGGDALVGSSGTISTPVDGVRSIRLLVATCTTCGGIDVRVDGVLVGRIETRSPYPRTQYLTPAVNMAVPATGTLTLSPVGGPVRLDQLVLAP